MSLCVLIVSVGLWVGRDGTVTVEAACVAPRDPAVNVTVLTINRWRGSTTQTDRIGVRVAFLHCE